MLLSPPSWLQQWSEVIAGLGTVVLTLFLVLLYKRQARQLEAQHEALLEVTDVEWYGDKAIIWVSNFGNGVAKDLRLTTLVKSDTGEHRNHVVRSNALKRIDKEGEWTNLIQPGEENVPFHGTSKVGKIAPRKWPGDWISMGFSNFVRLARANGANEVKFTHVITGAELSGNSCWSRVDPMTMSVNPQKFDRNHSLGDLPGKTKHGLDNTFNRYFRDSTFWKRAVRLYAFLIQILNKIVPRIELRPRRLDASGTKRVKRVLLKRDLEDSYDQCQRDIESRRSRLREFPFGTYIDKALSWGSRRWVTMGLILFFVVWYGIQLSVFHLIGEDTARWWFYFEKPPNTISPGILFAPISHDMNTLTHIGSNIVFLFIAGGFAEPYITKKKLLYVVLGFGYLGTYLANATALVHQMWMIAGVSGGILALWAYVGLRLRHKAYPNPSGREFSRESVEQIVAVLLIIGIPAFLFHEAVLRSKFHSGHVIGLLLGCIFFIVDTNR